MVVGDGGIGSGNTTAGATTGFRAIASRKGADGKATVSGGAAGSTVANVGATTDEAGVEAGAGAGAGVAGTTCVGGAGRTVAVEGVSTGTGGGAEGRITPARRSISSHWAPR